MAVDCSKQPINWMSYNALWATTNLQFHWKYWFSIFSQTLFLYFCVTNVATCIGLLTPTWKWVTQLILHRNKVLCNFQQCKLMIISSRHFSGHNDFVCVFFTEQGLNLTCEIYMYMYKKNNVYFHISYCNCKIWI